MIEPTQFEFGKRAPTPSGAIVPTYACTQLRQAVAATFMKIRTGQVTLGAAQAEIDAAFDDFYVRQAALDQVGGAMRRIVGVA